MRRLGHSTDSNPYIPLVLSSAYFLQASAIRLLVGPVKVDLLQFTAAVDTLRTGIAFPGFLHGIAILSHLQPSACYFDPDLVA